MQATWVHAALVFVVLLLGIAGNLVYVGYKDGNNDAVDAAILQRLSDLERHDEERVSPKTVDKLESRVDLLSDTNSSFDARITRIEVLLETQFNHIDDRFDRLEGLLSQR